MDPWQAFQVLGKAGAHISPCPALALPDHTTFTQAPTLSCSILTKSPTSSPFQGVGCSCLPRPNTLHSRAFTCLSFLQAGRGLGERQGMNGTTSKGGIVRRKHDPQDHLSKPLGVPCAAFAGKGGIWSTHKRGRRRHSKRIARLLSQPARTCCL